MTVKDFCDMCFDSASLYLEVFSSKENEVVFSGFYDDLEIPDEILDATVNTFDVPSMVNWITLNVD